MLGHIPGVNTAVRVYAPNYPKYSYRRIGQTKSGVPVFRATLNDYNKYKPHQGKKEIAKRAARQVDREMRRELHDAFPV